MANTCDTTAISVDYSPGVINLLNLREGFSYGDYLDFFDTDGDPEDISDMDFEMVIKDAYGTTVDTLETGSIAVDGLEIEGTNRLNFLISEVVTGTAGTYTFELILTDSTSGDSYPLAVGKIKVI